jgi:predicted aldo/keto reductase-like oxidoreductase
MKKLGFGLMRLPLANADDYTKIDVETMKKMVDTFISRGFTYFDTAYPYHNGYSEVAFREAVAKRYPRTAYTVTDKMPSWLINSKEDFQRLFDIQLERCGVEYFDYYWLHALNEEYYATMQKYGGFEFQQKMKAAGKIKHIGISFHDDVSLLERILNDHPETEYVQLQINYLDWEDTTIKARECYETVTRHGKPVIVMEPVKGGSLARVPSEAEKLFKSYHPDMSPAAWAIRYAASLDNVMMVLSGMSNEEQMNDNTSFMQNFEPLNDEERNIIVKAKDIIHAAIAIPCTACHYCTEGCPQHIAIPEYFALYNTIHQFGKAEQWMNTSTYYSVLNQTHGKASDCIECGQCEEHCPQHIEIIENLKKVAKIFE